MGDHIIDLLGKLRAYATVLVGSEELGDRHVATCLENLVADVDLPWNEAALRISAFQALARVVASAPRPTEPSATDPLQDDPFVVDIAELPWRERQALLLIALAEFSAADAAQVLETTTGEVRALCRSAIWRVAERVVGRRQGRVYNVEGLRTLGRSMDLHNQARRRRGESSPPPAGSLRRPH